MTTTTPARLLRRSRSDTAPHDKHLTGGASRTNAVTGQTSSRGRAATLLRGAQDDLDRLGLALDDAAWARGHGLALWKGLIMITNTPAGQAELAHQPLHGAAGDLPHCAQPPGQRSRDHR